MMPRPDVVVGKTYKIETGSGEMYITLNDTEEGKLFEMFITIGKSGGFVASLTEAIGRLISLCIRSGVDPKLVAKQLVGIRGPRTSFWKGKLILSVPDAIGRAMLAHLGQEDEALVGVQEDPDEEGIDSVPAQNDGLM